jgi:hypothetical protein
VTDADEPARASSSGPAQFATPWRFEPPSHVDHAAKYDALWRKQPHVLGFMQYARAIPGLAAQFQTRVPPEFTAQVDIDVLDIACPCGLTPRLARNEIGECACGRVFARCGGAVHVAYTDEFHEP